mgnify:CR=1 FL=1
MAVAESITRARLEGCERHRSPAAGRRRWAGPSNKGWSSSRSRFGNADHRSAGSQRARQQQRLGSGGGVGAPPRSAERKSEVLVLWRERGWRGPLLRCWSDWQRSALVADGEPSRVRAHGGCRRSNCGRRGGGDVHSVREGLSRSSREHSQQQRRSRDYHE